MYAADYGHTEIVRHLLLYPTIDVNAQGEVIGIRLSTFLIGMSQKITHLMQYKWFALYLAARGGHPEVVKLLLARPDINVNLKDKVVISRLILNHIFTFTLKAILLIVIGRLNCTTDC